MILIGMFDSPFVRRVAVSMNLLGMPFEHRNWSVGKDFELIVTQVYETVFRPPEKRYRPWMERCHTQMHAALAELNRLSQARAGEWLIGSRMTQADITATCAYTFLVDALAINRVTVAYPGLAAIAERCEALPEFRSVKAEWFPPGENS